jgi:sigma-B regulation protein RsbU (phosphoserine phosphatase)
MSTVKSFWTTIPRRSLVIFFVGVFLIFSIWGFAGDVAGMGRQPVLRFVLTVLECGIVAVFYAVAGFTLRKNSWKAFVPIFLAQQVLANLMVRWLPSLPQPAQISGADIARLQSRLEFDSIAIVVAMCVGYVCFLYVGIAEGRRYSRTYAEMELAAEIHRVLVPAIDTTVGDFECYGRSQPSGQVGGDLIDLAGSNEHWVAYVADVSGHGVAPGVVMGMVKSAARMLLSSGADTSLLLPRLNEVLYPLKKPDMFVTFCFVARNEHGLRVGLAGHPAILHLSARTGQVAQLESPNMPLGIFPSADFASSEIRTESGDVLALFTDGLLETANAAGEEFGLDRFQAELQKHGKESLDVICRSLEESVARHGAQFDDQSLLLLRQR